MCRSRIRGQFCTDSATTTHPGNSSTAVKRAENSLLPVEAAAALVASTVRESILASSERTRTRGQAPAPLRVHGRTGTENRPGAARRHTGTDNRKKRPSAGSRDTFVLHNNTMSAATKTENVITLKGSVAVVSEFFYCAINSILYQRGELAACAKVAQHRHVLFLANPINYYFGTSSRLSFSTCIAFIPHSPT